MMLVKDLFANIMDEIPELSDIGLLRRSINKIIGRINATIYGVYKREEAVKLENTGATALNNFSWDDTNKILTLAPNVKTVERVYVNKNLYKSVSREMLEQNSSERYFLMEQNNKIEFNTNNSEIALPTDNSVIKIDVLGLYSLKKIETSDTNIDIPSNWEDMLISGSIYQITKGGKYKNELLYKENKELFFNLLSSVQDTELRKIPAVDQVSSFYNYSKPSESI